MKQGRGSRGPTEARPGERESKRKKLIRERERAGRRGASTTSGEGEKKRQGTYPREREAGGSREKNKREEQKRRAKEREGGACPKKSGHEGNRTRDLHLVQRFANH